MSYTRPGSNRTSHIEIDRHVVCPRGEGVKIRQEAWNAGVRPELGSSKDASGFHEFFARVRLRSAGASQRVRLRAIYDLILFRA